MSDKKEKGKNQQPQNQTPSPAGGQVVKGEEVTTMNLQQTQEKLHEVEANSARLQGQLIKLSTAYNNLYAEMDLYRKQVVKDSIFIAKILTTTDDHKEKA